MQGDIVLDEGYNSGIEGRPGARFSIFLNRRPLELEPFVETAPPEACPVSPMLSPLLSPTLTPSVSKDDDMTEYDEDRGLPEVCSVLFVDDDTLLRRLFARSLKKVKPTWKVEQASNGETALELVANSHYDIIFMDRKYYI